MKERVRGSLEGLLQARNLYFSFKVHEILAFYFIMHFCLY